MALATMPNCSLRRQLDATVSTRHFDVDETSDVTRKSFTDLHMSEEVEVDDATAARLQTSAIMCSSV